ncbi:MAG: ATP-binding protein [Spirochaetes bacterium]|nr:ATP-binding protein [Spirochaetota bacterium]
MWVEKILQTKKPEKIHLENLIEEKRMEDANLEYKRLDVIKNKDKESLIKSVIGLAHGQGGLLILGMDEGDKLDPIKLIWGDAQVYTKEKLESILRDNIDPMISLTIHPIINQNEIVFVLDIPRSDRIHIFKKNNICYQRIEFQVRRMSPSDIEMFVKGAIHYSSCAYFRYRMKSEMHYWFDEVLGRIDPEYDNKEIEEIQLIDRFEILLEMINKRKPLHNKYLNDANKLFRVSTGTHLFTSVIKDVLKYDYTKVTPDERILIQKISGIVEQDNENTSRESINYLEESIKKNDEEMIEYNLRGFFLSINLLDLGSISIRLAKKYLELENNYGDFRKFISEDIY